MGNFQISNLCTCYNKSEGQKYLDDYFNSLSITSQTKIIDKEKLIMISENTFDDIKKNYIKTSDPRFENTHDDFWNTAPIAVFQSNYRYIAWSIIFMSNIPSMNKIEYLNHIEKLPLNNNKVSKDDVSQFLSCYINFISSFASSMLKEKVKGTSPDDLSNCEKYFDKRIREHFLKSFMKQWEKQDKIDLNVLFSKVDRPEDIRLSLERLHNRYEAF